MIEHEGIEFDDSLLRPFMLSKRLWHNYTANQCEIFTVCGMPEGIGKSAYCNWTLADLEGFKDCHDSNKLQYMTKPKPKEAKIWDCNWEGAKKYIRYKPEEVCDLFIEMMEKDKRGICFTWDDAGSFLQTMSFHDQFVIAFMSYLATARTNWAGVILSSPVEDWLLKKLRTSKGLIHILVTQPTSDEAEISKLKSLVKYPVTFRIRLARGYLTYKNPAWHQTYNNRVISDYFPAIMDGTFYKWYKPTRDSYAKLSVLQMAETLKARKARGESIAKDEMVLKSISETLDPEQRQKEIDRANDRAQDLIEMVQNIEVKPN
jgi:hypothetical protein